MIYGLSQSQSLKQSQNLQQKLSPKLIQTFKLLQAPINDLAQHIQYELTENPFLQEDSASDVLYEEMSSNFNDVGHTVTHSGNTTSVSNIIEATATGQIYLSDELIEQLNVAYEKDSLEWKIGEKIINYLNEDGYFLESEISAVILECGTTKETVLSILQTIQDFYPPGVAAGNLKECLLLQLKQLKNEDKASPVDISEEIIKNHLEWLGKNKATAEKKIIDTYQKTHTNLSVATIQKAMEIIAMLEPKPSRPYGAKEVQYISPDLFIFVQDDANQSLTCQVNDYFLPKINFNNEYDKYMHLSFNKKKGQASQHKELKNYLQEKRQSAHNLLNDITYRKSSLQKVGEQLINEQKEFFLRGPAYLKPKLMQTFAEEIEVHSSTLSRIVNQKYIQTPFGIFSLRIFFAQNAKFKTQANDAKTPSNKSSSHQIKLAIMQILQEHQSKKLSARKDSSTTPTNLNDLKLTQLLNEAGYNIARRTVTKYRNQLNILSSFYR